MGKPRLSFFCRRSSVDGVADIRGGASPGQVAANQLQGRASRSRPLIECAASQRPRCNSCPVATRLMSAKRSFSVRGASIPAGNGWPGSPQMLVVNVYGEPPRHPGALTVIRTRKRAARGPPVTSSPWFDFYVFTLNRSAWSASEISLQCQGRPCLPISSMNGLEGSCSMLNTPAPLHWP